MAGTRERNGMRSGDPHGVPTWLQACAHDMRAHRAGHSVSTVLVLQRAGTQSCCLVQNQSVVLL